MKNFLPKYVADWKTHIENQSYDKSIPKDEVEYITGQKLSALYNWATAEHYITWAGTLCATYNAFATFKHIETYHDAPIINPALGIAALVTIGAMRAMRDGTIAGILQNIDRKIEMPPLQASSSEVHHVPLYD